MGLLSGWQWRRGVLAARATLAAGLAAGLATGLTGCVQVPPAPVSLPTQAEARGRLGLDRAAVSAEAARRLPGRPDVPAAIAAGHLDKAALFAALLVHSPKIAEARAAVLAARKAAVAADKVGGATLSLSAEYANDPAASSPWALGAAGGLPLDLGGVRQARRQTAGLAVVAAGYALAETIWAERMALVRALAELHGAERQARIEAGLLDLRDRQLAVLENRAAQGEIAALDLAPYRAQRAQAARLLDEAKLRGAAARAAIAGTLGLPAAALAGVTLDWPDFAEPGPLTPPDNSATALAARSDVLQALAGYDLAEADLRREVAQQYPAITLGPGYTWERGLVKLPFTLGLVLPSWDRNHAAIAAAEARRQQAGAAIETALALAQAGLALAEAEHRTALAALARIRRAELPQAVLAADRAEQQLALGAIGRAEWAASQIAALEAQRGELDALMRVRTAEAALEDALRQPLSGPERAITAPPAKDLR